VRRVAGERWKRFFASGSRDLRCCISVFATRLSDFILVYLCDAHGATGLSAQSRWWMMIRQGSDQRATRVSSEVRSVLEGEGP
jgi:hypothetical protein